MKVALSKLLVEELQNICERLRVDFRRSHNKSEIIQRIVNDRYELRDLTICELEDICESLNITKSGNKSDIISRIQSKIAGGGSEPHSNHYCKCTCIHIH